MEGHDGTSPGTFQTKLNDNSPTFRYTEDRPAILPLLGLWAEPS